MRWTEMSIKVFFQVLRLLSDSSIVLMMGLRLKISRIWCREWNQMRESEDDAKQVSEIFIRIDYFVESTLAMRKMRCFSSIFLLSSADTTAGAASVMLLCCFYSSWRLGRNKSTIRYDDILLDIIFLLFIWILCCCESKSQHLLNFLSSLSRGGFYSSSPSTRPSLSFSLFFLR